MKLAIRYNSMIKYSYITVGQFLATTSVPPHGDCWTRVVCIDLVCNTSRMWWYG